MLDPKKKQAVIKKFATHDGDTGSSQVQIAILTEEIKELTEHLKTHKKDFSSRRGLLRKVNLRRKLLKFLEKEDFQSYEEIIKKLKIKKKSFIEKLAKKPVEEHGEEKGTTEKKQDND